MVRRGRVSMAALPTVTDGASLSPSARGPAARVVGEGDAVGAQPVDQGGCVGPAGPVGRSRGRACSIPEARWSRRPRWLPRLHQAGL